MVIVQATKRRKDVPYGKQFSTYKMGMQVSYRLYTKVSQKDYLQGIKKRHTANHKGFVQMERRRDYRGAHDAGSRASTLKHTT